MNKHKVEHKNIIVENCTKEQANNLINRLTDQQFHNARSHGSWFEFNKVSYFVTVNYVGKKDIVKVQSAGKSLNRDERSFYKFIK